MQHLFCLVFGAFRKRFPGHKTLIRQELRPLHLDLKAPALPGHSQHLALRGRPHGRQGGPLRLHQELRMVGVGVVQQLPAAFGPGAMPRSLEAMS